MVTALSVYVLIGFVVLVVFFRNAYKPKDKTFAGNGWFFAFMVITILLWPYALFMRLAYGARL